MDKIFKLSVAFALALFVGGNVLGQEWEQSYEWHFSDDEEFDLVKPYETFSGNIVVSTNQYYKCGWGDFYAPHPALKMFAADGTELAENLYFKPAYYGGHPHIIENKKGELYMMASYTPDHDYTSFNYFLNYDNPPDEGIYGLYKLDDQLNIVEAFEHHIKIDTSEYRDQQWEDVPLEQCGALVMVPPVVDDDIIVGAYMKTYSRYPTDPHGPDSLFVFRMDFEGNILEQQGFELPYMGSGGSCLHFLGRELMFKTEAGYMLYCPFRFVDDGNFYHVVYLDNNLNLLKIRPYKKIDPLSQFDDLMQGIKVKRSRHNTTYFAVELASNNPAKATDYDVRLYELDDNIDGTEPYIPSLQYITRTSDDLDWPSGIELLDDNSLCFAYTLNIGFWSNLDSWMMIEHLTHGFDTISTLYYDHEGERIHSTATSILATNDGGLLLVYQSKNLDNTDQRWTTITKFPAEAFVGIEEAHDSGLKVAIAYPNPGKDVLNIRTGLQNARVEVYDLSGKLICNQEITENVTSINAESWPSGVYVWKVYTNQAGPSTGSGTLAETGKWIKE